MEKSKFQEIEKNLDSSMRMRLNQLRTFLDMGKASVMVGAGFSKNADMGENINMKDWGELCEEFYATLYNSKPCDRDLRLKSALRFAQQIESTMGRNALDEIIKNSLPNDSIAPGYLHKLLVSLNWRDIFTTNYDSLLEDAAVKAYRHYNVVTSKDSLIYQPHPRIVKLHGSFPDNRPFIITEEDYRTYPEHFPEFVNTIRQALIETQFCLIGFSSDDPNFLSWLGWFRDIMKQQMLPIYMIYVGSRPHDSEIKLLSSRKVEPIITADISENPVEAIDFILTYIGNKFKEKKEWTGNLAMHLSDCKALKASIDKMREIRESYPGWIILPANRIKTDFDDCRAEFAFIGNSFSELGDEDKLSFLYEYTWRLQTSFTPSWLNTEWYVTAIYDILDQNINPEDKKKVDYLSVALLQILRITDDDDFKTKLPIFRDRIPFNNTALRNKLIYEEALWAISHCEFISLNKILDSWEVTPDDYRGALWKSKLLKEIDKNEEAVNILEASLENARRKLMSNSELEFQLSAATLIANCLPHNTRFNNNQSKTSDETFYFVAYYNLCKEGIKTEKKSGMTQTHGFNIGEIGTSWHSGRRGYIEKYVDAGRYYLLSEAYGQPIGTKLTTYNSNINQLALPLIANIGFDVALSYLVESNDQNALKATLSRQNILNISENDAIRLFDSWVKVLTPYMESNIKLPWLEREANIVLPILARLCVWLDNERIIQIINLIRNNYDSYRGDLSDCLKTCYNSLSIDIAVKVWWDIMESPIVLDYVERDIIRPYDIGIKEWQGTDFVVDIITEGLANDSLPICKAAVIRFRDIRKILPLEYRNKIDNAILANFDKLLNTDVNLISILGVDFQPRDVRRWKERFYTSLEDQYNNFINADFKIKGASIVISKFEKYLITFINCYQHLTVEQTNLILGKVLEFIIQNYETLTDTNDSDSLFGGLKRFLDSAMNCINIFITRVAGTSIQYKLRNELFEKMKLLNDSYPLIRAIVSLSFIDKSGNTSELVKENRQFVRNCLEKDVISSDHNRMWDAFNAAAETQQLTKGPFSIQEIVKSSIDHIRYHLDPETSHILFLMPLWLSPNIIMKQNLKILFNILAELPQRIIASEIDAELKSDMLYYGARLAGKISITEFEDVDKTECVESWQSFANSHDFPHDIRNGFFKYAE